MEAVAPKWTCPGRKAKMNRKYMRQDPVRPIFVLAFRAPILGSVACHFDIAFFTVIGPSVICKLEEGLQFAIPVGLAFAHQSRAWDDISLGSSNLNRTQLVGSNNWINAQLTDSADITHPSFSSLVIIFPLPLGACLEPESVQKVRVMECRHRTRWRLRRTRHPFHPLRRPSPLRYSVAIQVHHCCLHHVRV